MRRWIVDYKTQTCDHMFIEIHCADKSEVRAILKKHLGRAEFKINKITENVVADKISTASQRSV